MYTALAEKHILITGAASGVGRAAVEAVASAGGRISALDLNAAALETLKGELPEASIHTTAMDVSQEDQVEAAIAQAVRQWGPIDGCLNNAGIGAPLKELVDLERSDFTKTLEVNMFGSFNVLKHVLRHMKESGHGAVVNTGSVLGDRGTKNYAVYCAAKAAVHAMTKVAALEMASAGIRVNAIAPGMIDTPMNDVFHSAVNPEEPARVREAMEAKIPLERYATPTEVAGAALMLLTAASGYITGQVIGVDGGSTASFL